MSQQPSKFFSSHAEGSQHSSPPPWGSHASQEPNPPRGSQSLPGISAMLDPHSQGSLPRHTAWGQPPYAAPSMQPPAFYGQAYSSAPPPFHKYPPEVHPSHGTVYPPPRLPLSEQQLSRPVSDDPELEPPPSNQLARRDGPSKAPADSVKDAKGKARVKVEGSGLKRKAPSLPPSNEKKKGRTAGIANYSKHDVSKLLRLLKEVVPLGQLEWKDVTGRFNRWADENKRPQRAAKSLETKFKQFSKAKKPTGDAECPPEIELALEIDALMNEKAGTRELDDEEFDDAPDDDDDHISVSSGNNSDEEKENKPPRLAKKPRLGPVTVRASDGRLSTSTSRRRNPTPQDFMSTLSNSLDPEAQRARAQEHTFSTMQMTQLFSLNNQVRDLNQQLDTLRTQLSQEQRLRDRAETLLAMSRSQADSYVTPARPRVPVQPRPPQRRRREILQEIHYPEGGRATHVVDLDADIGDPDVYDHFQRSMASPFRAVTVSELDIDEDPCPSHPPSPSPFQSASRGLNNRLPSPPPPPPPPSRRQGIRASPSREPFPSSSATTRDDVAIHVHPNGEDSSLSVVISPRRRHDSHT